MMRLREIPAAGGKRDGRLEPRVPGSTPVSGVGESVPLSQASVSRNIRYAKRGLPHFEKPWTIYAVTMSKRGHQVLSLPGRTIVLNALLHFHMVRYELFAACVMPDHVHFLFQPWPKTHDVDDNAIFWGLPTLLHSIKSFTAHEINALEKKTGPLWEEEYFDRYIRSERDLQEKFEYICENPWRAAIVGSNEDYPWLWTPEEGLPSSFRRDAETNARDGRAPRKADDAQHVAKRIPELNEETS